MKILAARRLSDSPKFCFSFGTRYLLEKYAIQRHLKSHRVLYKLELIFSNPRPPAGMNFYSITPHIVKYLLILLIERRFNENLNCDLLMWSLSSLKHCFTYTNLLLVKFTAMNQSPAHMSNCKVTLSFPVSQWCILIGFSHWGLFRDCCSEIIMRKPIKKKIYFYF